MAGLFLFVGRGVLFAGAVLVFILGGGLLVRVVIL
jgi:hypothetical protein